MMKHAFAGAALIAGLIAAAPASAQLAPAEKCYDCPQPREHYDTQETIRTTRDVDHSRVIETQSEVPVSRRVKETNHLIIRENETRNVGVVQHNHTIIERVPRYVVRVPVVTTVSYVTQQLPGGRDAGDDDGSGAVSSGAPLRDGKRHSSGTKPAAA